MDELNLSDLDRGSIPAITPAIGKMLGEASGVCLESQGHSQGVILNIRGDCTSSYSVAWTVIGQHADAAWNDAEYATEHGAVGIAILLVKREIGYEVIQRSRKGTGIDYWLGDNTDVTHQRKARLEVSGIRQGDGPAVRARVRNKLRQTNRSAAMHGGLPVFVIVVEFSMPLAEVRQK